MTTPQIILASGSEIRATLLRNAGLSFAVETARVDETAVRQAMEAEQAPPRDVADALAELKAQKVATRHPEAMVIGCDQILSLKHRLFAKADSPQAALSVLRDLRGQTHMLHSAAVIFHDGAAVWRHIGQVRLGMRPDISDAYLEDYVTRNWESIRHAVGCYKLEEEGVRLFSRIDGDYFTVLGLPLLPLLSYLSLRGILAT